MSKNIKVLVAYASKYQSTTEIATFIADILRTYGTIDVEVRPVEYVDSVTRYDAVIVGSALYIGQWLPQAVVFLRRNLGALAQRDVWLFSTGLVNDTPLHGLMKNWFQFPQSMGVLFARIRARDMRLFQGKLDPQKLNSVEHSVIAKSTLPVGDYRPWDDIRVWASSIGQILVSRKADDGHDESRSFS